MINGVTNFESELKCLNNLIDQDLDRLLAEINSEENERVFQECFRDLDLYLTINLSNI